MKILTFSCKNFRNLSEISINPVSSMNVICGENAQGKTNILEAIWLFTGAKSFRKSKDFDFIQFEKQKGINSITFLGKGIENDAQMHFSEHRTAVLNNNKLKSTAALAGKFNAIIFSPADLSLITEGPAARRRFMDIAISQVYPQYIELLRKYMRAVVQRNQIIKEYRYDQSLSIMLDVFEEEIAENGIKIIQFRKRYLKFLNEFLPSIYFDLSSGRESLFSGYIESAPEGSLRKSLFEKRKEDIYSGSTSCGPHRDDIDFKINEKSVRIYGSQGQKRSVALSLKLSEAQVINKLSGEYPVCLLDDVMSELDPNRQNYILNHIKDWQSFLTCCDPSNIKGLKEGKVIRIENGKVLI